MKTVSLIVLILAVSCSAQVWRVPSSFVDGTKWQLNEEGTPKVYLPPVVQQRTYTPTRLVHVDESARPTPLRGHAIPQQLYTQPAYTSRAFGQPAHNRNFGTAGEVNIVEGQYQQQSPKFHTSSTHIPLRKTVQPQGRISKAYLPARPEPQDTWPPRLKVNNVAAGYA